MQEQDTINILISQLLSKDDENLRLRQDNGQAEIDNNTAEQLMKPICLGRKNYLFCASEQAAKNTSLIYSIIESYKMNGFRPVKYIADVLQKLVSGDTDYMALLLMNIIK